MTLRKTEKKDTTKQTVVVGKIYAEWCHFCQELAPHWEHMKRVVEDSRKHYKVVEISDKDLDAGIERINRTYLANSDKKLALQGGYPTIFKIVDGHLTYYHGSHSGLMVWATGSAHKQPRRIMGHGVVPEGFMGGARKNKTRKNKIRKASRKVSRKASRKNKTQKLFSWFGLA